LIARTPGRVKVCACLLAANLLFIWGNSLLPASLSGAISGWIKELFWFLFPQSGSQGQGEGLLRKLAHFLEFAALGALLCWLFAMLRKNTWAFLLPAVGCSCLTACIDETLQLFVPGRSAKLADVGIDLAGSVLAAILFSLVCTIKKNKKPYNNWRKHKMKKIFALLLAVVMVMSMSACEFDLFGGSDADTETTTEPAAPIAASALEILETVWGQADYTDKPMAMGGDFENLVDNAPGKVNVASTDFLTFNLIVPADQTANITDAASVIHAMNANTFTCGAYAVADAQAFATAMQTAIQGNQWMCGFPEKLLIAEVGGYVVVVFGHGDAVTPFQTALTTAYPTTQILVNEAIG